MVAFAPGIAVHTVAVAVHRCHAYVKLIGAAPDQVPFETVSDWPSVAVPLTIGVAVLTGAVETTGPAAFEVALFVPRGVRCRHLRAKRVSRIRSDNGVVVAA